MALYYKWDVKTGFTFDLPILISDGLGGVESLCIICSKHISRIPIMERREKDLLIFIIIIIVALIGFCTYIYCGGGNGHGCGRGHDGEGVGYGKGSFTNYVYKTR